MRLTDADKLETALGYLNWVFEQAETIDPIHAAGGCYCRECIYYEKGKDHTPYCNCEEGLANPDDDAFCSYGRGKQARE